MFGQSKETFKKSILRQSTELDIIAKSFIFLLKTWQDEGNKKTSDLVSEALSYLVKNIFADKYGTR